MDDGTDVGRGVNVVGKLVGKEVGTDGCDVGKADGSGVGELDGDEVGQLVGGFDFLIRACVLIKSIDHIMIFKNILAEVFDYFLSYFMIYSKFKVKNETYISIQ